MNRLLNIVSGVIPVSNQNVTVNYTNKSLSLGEWILVVCLIVTFLCIIYITIEFIRNNYLQ